MKTVVIRILKIIFFCYSVLFLFYYVWGLWFAANYTQLSWHHLWMGLSMLVLIFLNVKFIQKEYNRD